ncbi:MAG TPA: hypothetical protein H9964_03525 [Candidatus Gallimonas intestinavium]|uniref:Uncharacterized protein n=1 Tax=Candidatus Gallimonas intestinavium TaxID=2838603 RepID=A0A9D2G4V2_9FIRM|nr:hypothetical protein [Candidatus Gallimonas intestinavium]
MALGNFRARANNTQRTTRALITSSVIPVESTKKTMKVDLRVNEDLWRTFVEDCQRKGVSASSELRRFMEEQVRETEEP